MVAVFKKDSTLYENYSPESAEKGEPAEKDFVGWSGLFPITIMFEYVFGINPHAREEKIVWDVRLLEKHGVKNYPFNDLSIDLICEKRASEDEEPIVTALCEKPIEIEIRYGNRSKIIHASPKN